MTPRKLIQSWFRRARRRQGAGGTHQGEEARPAKKTTSVPDRGRAAFWRLREVLVGL